MDAQPASSTEQGRPGSAVPPELVAACYDELRRSAHRALAGWSPAQTLQATALVHEAWLRMAKLERFVDLGRPAFLAFAALHLRRILVESHRARNTEIRGGHLERAPLFDSMELEVGESVDLEALDDALERLSEVDERAARVVDLRFFGGLTEAEAAEVLGVSTRTASSLWRYARSWLALRLKERP